MTRDLDTLLRNADPLRDRPADDDAVLVAARARVDREREGIVPARRRAWGRRVVLIAAAAAVLTAVPLVLSAVLGTHSPRRVLQAAVAAQNGSVFCGSGYAAAIHPEDASVRLLPDVLPAGWSYTKIFAREDVQYGWCVPPSLTALQVAPDGTVTARLAVTGPIPARLDQVKLHGRSAPDTVDGHPARRYDLQRFDVASHHWLWNDEQGRLWQAEVSGLPLAEAQQALATVTTQGAQVSWDAAAAPGWRQVQLRTGAPYGVDPRRLIWYAEMTGGPMRTLMVYDAHGARVPLWAAAGVGEQLTTIGGHPAILGQVRTAVSPGSGETDVPAGTVSRPVSIEITPGTEASTWATADDLPQVERMLASLRQVSPSDPRLEKYATD